MTYPEALQYFDSFQNYELTVQYHYPEAFSLDRVRALLRGLGDPQDRYPTLHVAGTKGKGSTCAFAASILRTSGLRTGLYTSPHLLDFRERFQINGVPIPEAALDEIIEQLQRAGPEKGLTYFEVTTAAAFLYFAREQVDAAVIEVGLGGRLDATNVLRPAVTAITPVSHDHMDKLGTTLALIAREKAGILKTGVPAVLAPQEPEALAVIEETAARIGAPLHRVDPDFLRLYPSVRVPLPGRHQQINAAVAILMTELFFQRYKSTGYKVPDTPCFKEGIERTVWPGRCQLIEGDPPVLLDGAQNAASARALKETVEALFPGRPVTLVVGISTDKDLEGMAREWGPWARRIFLAQAATPRAESIERLRERFSSTARELDSAGSVREAVHQAKESAGPGAVVVVSGSLFVVAEALRGFLPAPAGQKHDSAHGSHQKGNGSADD